MQWVWYWKANRYFGSYGKEAASSHASKSCRCTLAVLTLDIFGRSQLGSHLFGFDRLAWRCVHSRDVSCFFVPARKGFLGTSWCGQKSPHWVRSRVYRFRFTPLGRLADPCRPKKEDPGQAGNQRQIPNSVWHFCMNPAHPGVNSLLPQTICEQARRNQLLRPKPSS